MYEFAYNSIVEESSRAMRAQEARALDRVIAQMREAESYGPRSKAGIHALYQLRTLWTVFLDDLNGPDNALPTPLRARLLSIGIWVIKEIERLRTGEADEFSPIIEINQIIRDGLN
jgi:flagellar protein FlaF